ncbi:MAG TPA: LUD domain-containing protein [Thermoleophilia bacterium]|nr:LUD domain-containing protein [Thermoleophilia bacterium]
MTETKERSTLVPNREFAVPAGRERLERAAAALQANGIEAVVAGDLEQAKRLVLERLPEGAEVHEGASVTMETLGVTAEIERSGRYDAVRPRIWAMDRETQMREMRKLGAGPDYVTGSAHAVTEDGHLVFASKTGSQLAAYAYGAGHVVLAAGSQKIVRDVDEGLRRIREYVYPLEDQHMLDLYGMHSVMNKLLVVMAEEAPRISIVLIDQPVGF